MKIPTPQGRNFHLCFIRAIYCFYSHLLVFGRENVDFIFSAFVVGFYHNMALLDNFVGPLLALMFLHLLGPQVLVEDCAVALR